VLTKARQHGAFTLAVTNVPDSPLGSVADEVLACDAGPEHSVAATKTYTSTCLAIAALASELPGGARLRPALERTPDRLAAALQVEQQVAGHVARYVHAPESVVLGRAFHYATAREMALKLEETCYLIATPFSTADFQHGPAALVERGLPVLVFVAPGPCLSEAQEILRWLRDQRADTVVVSEDSSVLELATTAIRLELPEELPEVAELLSPIVYIAPGQLFAQYLAIERGLDPDHPRSLTKVTRTR
jgi:glucosamine--fructose-6-phosphate aminotransferase (isomerizing)